jgi:hypothetical protein
MRPGRLLLLALMSRTTKLELSFGRCHHCDIGCGGTGERRRRVHKGEQHEAVIAGYLESRNMHSTGPLLNKKTLLIR